MFNTIFYAGLLNNLLFITLHTVSQCMNLKPYFILLFLSTLLSWIMWFLVLKTINPEEANIIGFLFFYTSLGLATAGTYTTCMMGLQQKIFSKKNYYNEISVEVIAHILKQGIIVTGGLLLSLILLHYHILTWWNSIVLGILVILLTKTLQSLKKHKKSTNYSYVK